MLVYIQDFLILQGVLYIAYIFFSSFSLVRMVMCNEIHNTDHLLSLFVFLTVVVECTSVEYVICVLGLMMDARCTCFSLRVSFASSESYMLCYGKLLCICVWVNALCLNSTSVIVSFLLLTFAVRVTVNLCLKNLDVLTFYFKISLNALKVTSVMVIVLHKVFLIGEQLLLVTIINE